MLLYRRIMAKVAYQANDGIFFFLKFSQIDFLSSPSPIPSAFFNKKSTLENSPSNL